MPMMPSMCPEQDPEEVVLFFSAMINVALPVPINMGTMSFETTVDI